MGWLTKHFPFNREQTVNVLGEMGPLMAMFIVNGVWGIAAGTWALIITTVMALVMPGAPLGPPPIMPFIAGSVSITFGILTLVTGDPKWVQIKVTIFNTLVAGLLWWGLKTDRNFFEFVFGKTFHYTKEGWNKLAANLAFKEGMRKANPVLLEPMMAVEVETPEDYMGDVMGDLNRRRGIIQGMDDVAGVKAIKAEVPLAEMFGYATDLRSMSQGRATYTMEFKHYAEAPKSVAEAVIAKK